MSYLVLARKWRPRTFSEVVGQDHVTHTLMKAVEKGRLAHAYLFAGPRGCGKTTAARLLAKVINCQNRKDAEPCNECPSCVAVSEGRHFDLIEIDGASNRGIDEIRDLREKIGYSPTQGNSKIYIIDEVHMLTTQAFNALLKTLEEPPPHVYLVFATTEPHKVPATILSRCQRFNFKRMELKELEGRLREICTSEKVGFDAEALVLICRHADGSMRDAISLLDQCISASDEKIDLELVRNVLGLVDSQIVEKLLHSIGERDREKVLGIVDDVVSSGLDLEEFYLAFIEGLRNLIVLSIKGEGSSGWLDLTGEEMDRLGETVKFFNTEDLLFLFRSAVKSFRDFKGTTQPRYQLEAAMAEAASWDSVVELSELIKRIDHIGGGGRGAGETGDASRGPVGGTESGGAGRVAKPGGASPRGREESYGADGVTMDPRSDEVGDIGSVDDEEGCGSGGDSARGMTKSGDPLSRIGGGDQWERFLAQVREAKLTLGIWLMSAEVRGIEDDRVILSFSPQNRFASEMISEEKNKSYIESRMERFFGRKLVIEIAEQKFPRSSPQKAESRGERKLPPEIDKLAEGSPIAKRLIEEFDGELYTGR